MVAPVASPITLGARGPPPAAKRRASFRVKAEAGAHSSPPPPPYVKVCGVTNAEDAETAAAAGANLIGMIMWPKAKRSISTQVAQGISAAARRHAAAPVAVFVDEDAATIERVCRESDIGIAQLHGDGARAALPDLPAHLQVVYVMHADKGGELHTPLPQRAVQWVLLDSLKGGSGESFDWCNLRPPVKACTLGWLLAGGLTPGNVGEAVRLARPAGVDVSSGVCGPDGLKKDAERVQQYVRNAQLAFMATVT